MATKLSKMGPLGGAHTSGIFSDMTVDGPEIGMLVVIFDRAKNLPNRRSMGKQDPYCAARLGKEAKKTATDKRGGQTPRWDQELRFTVHDSPDYHNLKVSVFNDDKKTEMIGEAWISLEEVVIPGGGKSDSWHGLNCKGKYAGELRMEITYYDTRPKPDKSVEETKKRALLREGSGELSSAPMPSVGGPRDSTTVKRRPLPSNPNSASPSPSGLREKLPAAPSVAPRRNQPLSTHEIEAKHAHKRHTHYGLSNTNLAEQVAEPEPIIEPLRPEPSRSQNSLPYDAPAQPMQPAEPVRSSRYGDAWRDPVPSSRTYGRNTYEQQPIDAMPPVAAHGRERTVRRLEMHDDAPTYPPRRPQSYLETVHTNSAPIVPTTGERRSSYQPRPEVPERSHSLPVHDDQYSPGADYQNDVLQHSPSQYTSHSPYGDHGNAPNFTSGYRDTVEENLYGSPYGGAAKYALQPTVEDENDVPPPPPMHRSSAPPAVEQDLYSGQAYTADMRPAPLRITPSRDNMYDDGYAGALTYHSRYSPGERRNTMPLDRPVSRGDNQPSPLRNELPASLIPGYERTAYDTPLDRSPQTDNRLALRSAPAEQYSPSGSYQTSPYDTPQHQRHMSQQDFQTPPNYGTSPRPHQLALQENVAPQRSPVYPAASTADQYALQRVPRDPPMVKPRPVSPNVAVDPRQGRGPSRETPTRKSVSPRPPLNDYDARQGRGPARSTPTRKSVSPRPPVEDTNRRLSSAPFGPDDFAAFNPNAPQPISHTDNVSNAGSFVDQPEQKGPILGFDGRVIDPSDHLPVESYAPEPESKGPQRNVPFRERDRLNGARALTRRVEDDEDFTRSSLPMIPVKQAETHTSASHGRNRLQKRITPGSNHSAPTPSAYRERDVSLHYQHSPSPYSVGSRRDAGNRQPQLPPPIPAKIPLNAGGDDLARLSEELGRIDIGSSGNGTWRRGARGMTPTRRY